MLNYLTMGERPNKKDIESKYKSKSIKALTWTDFFKIFCKVLNAFKNWCINWKV